MWDAIIVNPMTNALLYIYSFLGQNFGLSIIVFTILIRLATYPLTANQLKSAQKLQELQKSKKWLDMQKKYENDKEKLAQEQMKLYKEAGVNPLGSCLPTLVQFPIIIGLYGAIISALAATPLQLLEFSKHLYSFFPNVAEVIPLNSRFLWMDLGLPERLFLPFLPDIGIPLLAILVFVTSYLQTKLTTTNMGDTGGQAASMGKMMSIYMPLFIGYLSMTYAAGLALYFLAGNLVTIAQYAMMGRLDLKKILPKRGEAA